MSLIPFGLKDGVLVEVGEVSQGLACGCICPACRGPLVARHGQINIHHFAHHSRASCTEAMGQAMLLAIVEALQVPACKLRLPGPEPRVLILEAVTLPVTTVPGGAAVQVWYRQHPLQLLVEWDLAAGTATRSQWRTQCVPSIALNLTTFIREIQHGQRKQIRKRDVQFWLQTEGHKSWIYRTPRPVSETPFPDGPQDEHRAVAMPSPVALARPRPTTPPAIIPRPRSQTPPSQEEIRGALMAQLAHRTPRAPVDVDLFIFRIETAIRLGVLADAGRRYLFKSNLLPGDDIWVGQVLIRLGYGVE
ncbi:competence protein CoiA family protein [Chromobacterium phragmitis]|uniref:Competence protein CoiA-like N-terminal domain-containing protein n=1 Tax=Chromobacterium phragmitis TaxID=2202141 RepID=A0A344UP33_9NEIS|nr:competence protein CoiA family protein [Chromobacterium phragmitis]AXE37031.1 hypothetical protein DK843_14845 [Chromobacterium phragmitis]